jgi:hypothetical protein
MISPRLPRVERQEDVTHVAKHNWRMGGGKGGALGASSLP